MIKIVQSVSCLSSLLFLVSIPDRFWSFVYVGTVETSRQQKPWWYSLHICYYYRFARGSVGIFSEVNIDFQIHGKACAVNYDILEDDGQSNKLFSFSFGHV